METEALGSVLRTAGSGIPPVRQFAWLLAILVAAGALLMAVGLGATINSYFAHEAARVTVDAVTLHFQYVFAHDVFEAPLAGPTLEAFERMVRAHMNLYRIAHVRVFRPDGTVVFSYRHDEIGRPAPADAQALVAGALRGEIRQEARRLDARETADGRSYGEVLALYVPITDGRPDGRVLGVAAVYRDVAPLYADIRRMQAGVLGLAAIVAVLLFFGLHWVFTTATERIQAQAVALRKAVRHIETTYDATLEALTAALDARDHETEGHSFRVCAYAVALGREMGVDGQALVDLARGALLHDVGKIGVRDAILTKPGPLTEAEWAEMRRHPELGYRMLAQVAFLQGALPVVLCHQERWDGTGYPAGLKGADIPLGARIFAVADTLDAITSNRPYRPAADFDTAAREILRCSGSQFDPAVVAAFFRIPKPRWQALRAQAEGVTVGSGGLRVILAQP